MNADEALERISKLHLDVFDGKYGAEGQDTRALEDAVYWANEALNKQSLKGE